MEKLPFENKPKAVFGPEGDSNITKNWEMKKETNIDHVEQQKLLNDYLAIKTAYIFLPIEFVCTVKKNCLD